MRVALLLLGACGFSARAAPDGATAIDGPRDAPGDVAAIDAPIQQAAYMLACSGTTLYQVDVDQGTVTALGPMVMNSTTYSMFALAGTATQLYGVPAQLNVILSIDPSTGTVTQSHSLAPQHDYYGFTYVPPGELGPQARWLAGTDGMGEPDGNAAHLYTVNPTTGMTTIAGQFGGGLTMAGDLAWVHGKGLFGTFYGPGCTTTCIASVDPASGTATVLTGTGPANALSLSGFRGQLWALDTAGGVWLVDTTNGNATFQFATGVQWADAAL